MPVKEWTASHNGKAIRVVNTWFNGARLYINGECRDTNTKLFAIRTPERPHLSAPLEPSDLSSPLVTVYFQAVLSVKAKIMVGGECVAGDLD